MTGTKTRSRSAAQETNKLFPQDRPVHRWYRFVLSYPPHLVRDYVDRLGISRGQRVLDPFCGTGTTTVECKKLGIASEGIESNPITELASRVKADWTPNPDHLVQHAKRVAESAKQVLEADGIEDATFFDANDVDCSPLRTVSNDEQKLLLKNSISPLPLHKTLVLLEALEEHRDERYWDHERLALADALVSSIGNLRFGPEVGVGKIKDDAPVVGPWLATVRTMAKDLATVRNGNETPVVMHHADARDLLDVIEPESIDAVITSPPYPNEKDYSRTTRLESVLLGFMRNRSEMQTVKRGLVRSNTRGVYKGDDDDEWVSEHPEVQRIADAIEERRIELGKTSGFERMYHRVTKLYFGGMAKHLAQLRSILRPGAQLAYVVGDQASYLRVMIRTGQLLADIAESLGYEVIDIDLFRTRMATATGEQLREEVVVLRWPGT